MILPTIPKLNSKRDKMSESIDQMKSLNSEAKLSDESLKMKKNSGSGGSGSGSMSNSKSNSNSKSGPNSF